MALNTRTPNGRVVAFAGGVGGAKLAHGLAQCLPPGSLTVIGNTGDDFRYYGLHVSPDLDTVMYTLAGIAHPVNGWGLAGDTRQMVESLRALGEESWFGLGDKDVATNLLRTAWLAEGHPLSAVTARLCAALHVGPTLLPMTDHPLATFVHTLEYGRLAFQEYFVRYRWQPTVTRLEYSGEAEAAPAPGVLDAIVAADLLVICPSNPVLSIEPILRVKAIREALTHRRVPCIAVSPVIAGVALKGPTVKIMAELGLRADVVGVAAYYGNLIDAIVVDSEDRAAPIPQRVLVTDIRMRDVADRARLAAEILNWSGSL
jgi:LPPG:FO 2-phospho-L-lactate transferase